MKTSAPTALDVIRKFAAAHDCAAFTDSDGFVALQSRLYDDDGVRQVRQAPDGCDFHTVEAWQTAIAETPGAAMRWIA